MSTYPSRMKVLIYPFTLILHCLGILLDPNKEEGEHCTPYQSDNEAKYEDERTTHAYLGGVG
jgi:hypothetical protein